MFGFGIRKYANIDALRIHDEAFDGIVLPSAYPTGLLAVTDEDLGDSMLAGEFEDRRGGCLGVKNIHVGIRFARALQVEIYGFLIFGADFVLLHIDHA